jgi:actin-related protein
MNRKRGGKQQKPPQQAGPLRMKPMWVLSHYSETNIMQILFNLLRIKGLYMFQTLLAHPQEALHKRHLVYCMRVMHSTPILVATN